MRDDPTRLSLTEIADAIRTREVSSVEVTRACLARIERAQPTLNAFLRVEGDSALEAAARADADLARGRVRGPLHGVPLAHKDMFYRAGVVTTCGSKIRRDFVPDCTATPLARLAEAGALHLGALNMSEFAMSATGHNDHYGHCRNPWDPTRITGGSSSGSGAAVAARLVFGALGSDTGGSIRLPAAFCGVTGLKPTYGRVSRFGALPLAPSLDTVGPLARTARDCARLTSLIAGPDPMDATASEAPVPDYEGGIEEPIRDLRVGVPTNYYNEGLAPDVEAAVRGSLEAFRSLGAAIVPIELPGQDAAHALGNLLNRAEAAAIHAPWMRSRPGDYMPQVRSRIQAGLLIPATRYIDALRMRGPLLAGFTERVFGKVDVVVAPVSPIPAPPVADSEFGAPRHAELVTAILRFTRPYNLLGLPTLALPCGFSAGGLPIGIQLAGRPFAEATLLRAGHAFQKATDWHRHEPGR